MIFSQVAFRQPLNPPITLRSKSLMTFLLGGNGSKQLNNLPLPILRPEKLFPRLVWLERKRSIRLLKLRGKPMTTSGLRCRQQNAGSISSELPGLFRNERGSSRWSNLWMVVSQSVKAVISISRWRPHTSSTMLVGLISLTLLFQVPKLILLEWSGRSSHGISPF